MKKRNERRFLRAAARPVLSALVAGLLAGSALAAPGVVTADNGLRLRSASNTSSSVITLLRSGSSLEVLEAVDDSWYRVRAGQQEGYVASQYVRLTDSQTDAPTAEASSPAVDASAPAEDTGTYGFVSASTLNVRKGPGTDQAKVATLSAGAQVEILEILDGWYRIESGYVSADYVTLLDPGVTAKQAEIVAYAHKFLGCPYVLGGSGPNKFDCSGLTQYVYKQFGYTLRRTATQQLSNGVEVSKENLLPGDLVFFNNANSNKARATHVGIYIGGGEFLHASSSKVGVIISSLNTPYYTRVYTTARRIL